MNELQMSSYARQYYKTRDHVTANYQTQTHDANNATGYRPYILLNSSRVDYTE